VPAYSMSLQQSQIAKLSYERKITRDSELEFIISINLAVLLDESKLIDTKITIIIDSPILLDS
jgi:hypothetical protein